MPKHKTRNKAPQHLWTNIWNPGNLFKMLMLAAAAGQVTANSTTISPSTSTGLSTVPAGNVTTTVPSNSTALDVTTTSNSTALTTAIPALRVWKESPAIIQEAYDALDDGEKDIFRELYEKSPSFARDFERQQKTERQQVSNQYLNAANNAIFTAEVTRFRNSPKYTSLCKEVIEKYEKNPGEIQKAAEGLKLLPAYSSTLEKIRSPEEQNIFKLIIRDYTAFVEEIETRFHNRQLAFENASSFVNLRERFLQINYDEWSKDLFEGESVQFKAFVKNVAEAGNEQDKTTLINEFLNWSVVKPENSTASLPEAVEGFRKELDTKNFTFHSSVSKGNTRFSSAEKELVMALWKKYPQHFIAFIDRFSVDQQELNTLLKLYKDSDIKVFNSIKDNSKYKGEIKAPSSIDSTATIATTLSTIDSTTTTIATTLSTIDSTTFAKATEGKGLMGLFEEHQKAFTIGGSITGGLLLVATAIVSAVYGKKHCSKSNQAEYSVTYRPGTEVDIEGVSQPFIADQASTTNISRAGR